MSEFNFKNPYSSENLALEFRKKKELKNILEVNNQDGPFYTIQDAIDQATPFSHIIVNQGIYKENLRVKIPNLYIEAKTIDSQVIVLGQNGPTIFINIDEGTSLNIHGLQICNRGLNSEEIKFKVKNEQFYKMINQNIFQTVNLTENLSNASKNEIMIYLQQGTLFLSKCNLSLNIFFKQSNQFLCSIFQDNNTKCVVNECYFKGSKIYPSTGIVSNQGNLSVKNSKFLNHKGNGIVMIFSQSNFCSIFQCQFKKNLIGVITSGYNSCSKIHDCEFTNNRIGIYLTLQSNITILKCQIYKNYLGMSIINSENIIRQNQIYLNLTNGIEIYSDENLISECIVQQNYIQYNHNNGISCSGQNNISRIKYNNILYNRSQGIIVNNKANIIICKNNIKFNLKEGIKICETASAFIQENLISDNIKANIAIGSNSQEDIIILKNEILNGRCQARIMNNYISGNNEAILCINSSPILSGNKIVENKNMGLLALKKNVLNLLENIFKFNKGPGLFIKDDFKGQFTQNEIQQNQIEMIVENKNNNINQILKENQINGDKRYSQISICKIFQIINQKKFIKINNEQFRQLQQIKF